LILVQELNDYMQQVSFLATNAWYLAFITGGVGFIGYILYTLKGYISDENEAWAVYESVRDRLEQDPRIRYTLGDPVKGAPQDSSNSRIRNSLGYNFEHTDAGDRLYLNFYMIGSRSKGAVSVERFRVINRSSYMFF
jgi:hypothetical protein